MLKFERGDSRSEFRGQRVRRLDMLLQRLRREKENSSKPKWLLHTGDLERLRNEARYCFVDVGLPAQDALQELSLLDFTKFKVLDKESHRAQYDWIEPSSCRVLDGDSEKQCIQNLDRLIELVERVQKMEETGSPIKPVKDASLPKRAGEISAPTRDLATLMKLKSLSQSQAAEAFGISSRAVRDLVRNNKLTKTAKGRIVCDQKFLDEFNARHSPLKK
jgi:hypothetical protein